MKPVESTYEILSLKSLNRSIDEIWFHWAIDMLEAGFDTEHLRILAGAGHERPYNQFYLQELTEKVLKELGLDYSNEERNFKNYATYLVKRALEGKKDLLTVLSYLRDIHMGKNYDSPYQDFYLLYYAKQDLLMDDVQWYWPDADRSNIEQVIKEYFEKWLKENGYSDSGGLPLDLNRNDH